MNEFDALSPLVSSEAHLIVEDTNVNGHPVLRDHGPGRAEALREWLPRHPNFEPDMSRERSYNTFNPGGYLRKR